MCGMGGLMCGMGVLGLVIAVSLDGERFFYRFIRSLYTECVDIGLFARILVELLG